MDLPEDIAEGWWWVRWVDGPAPEIVEILLSPDGEWRMARAGIGGSDRLDLFAHRWTAMERVAPPSWAQAETT